MSFIGPVIQHGRQGLSYLNLLEVTANRLLAPKIIFLFPIVHFLGTDQ